MTSNRDRAIADAYAGGRTGRQVAEQFGVCHSTVYSAVRRVDGDVRSVGPRQSHNLNAAAFAATPASPEASYWAGFILADGSVRRAGGPNVTIELQANDREHLMKARDFIMPTGSVTSSKNGAAAVFRAYGVALVRALRRFGAVPRKSYGHPMPELSEDEFWPFVRGYVDGDGCIGKYPQRTADGEARNHYWHLHVAGYSGFMAWLHEQLARRLPVGGSRSRTKSRYADQLSFVGSDVRRIAAELLCVDGLERKGALLRTVATETS